MANFANKRYFTKLDFKSGFFQLPLHPESKPITAFTCFLGLFQYCRLPMGLRTSSGVFQSLADRILRGIAGEFASAYLDDISIYSENITDHLDHIEQVLNRILGSGMRLKKSKCMFFQTKFTFLGFLVDKNGIRACPQKTIAISNMKPPATKKQVRSILGSFGYYRRHILNYSKLIQPLVAITRERDDEGQKVHFNWTPSHQQTLDVLKIALTNAPILTLPRLGYPFRLYCDASTRAIGSILTQLGKDGKERIILFLSHILPPAKRSWCIHTIEAFSVYYSFKKLKHWLMAADVTVFSDHRPLASFFRTKFHNEMVDRFSLFLSGFNARLVFLRAKKNLFADMLSRPWGDNPPDNGPPNSSEGDLRFHHIHIQGKGYTTPGYVLTVRHSRGNKWVEGNQVFMNTGAANDLENAPWKANNGGPKHRHGLICKIK